MFDVKRYLRRAAAAAVALLCCLPGPEAAAKKPGAILNVWPLVGGSPDGGEAFSILYQSTGL